MPVNKDKTVRTSMIVPFGAYREVRELAAANDVSVAWVLRHALMEFLRVQRGEKTIPLRRGNRVKKVTGRTSGKGFG